MVSLVVAIVVGWVVARAVDERDRAARREREARLLNYFATKALSGELLEAVLSDLRTSLVDALRPADCRIQVTAADRSYDVRGGREEPPTDRSTLVPISSAEEDLGTMTAWRSAGADGLGPEDQRLLHAAARQIAVVVELPAAEPTPHRARSREPPA